MTPAEMRARAENPKVYWVPENYLFDNAGICLDLFPDEGASALVADGEYTRQLSKDVLSLLDENERFLRDLSKADELLCSNQEWIDYHINYPSIVKDEK